MMDNESKPSPRESRINTPSTNHEMNTLVCLDFDGTIAEHRGGWEYLHTLFGTSVEGKNLTKRYDADEITFEEWCLGNVEAWRRRNVYETHVASAADAVKLTTGAESLMEHLQNSREIRFGIVSGGITDLMACVSEYDPEFTIGNELVYDDDGVPINVDVNVTPTSKADIVSELADTYGVSLDDVVHVGDSHTDTEAFDVVGQSILFCPDDRLNSRYRETTDVVINERDLKQVLNVIVDTLND